VSNKNNNEHLPKIIFDESNKVNDINDIKNNYLKTEENEMLPKIKEQRRNNAGDSMEETVEQGAVIKEELAEIFIDGEDAVPMSDIDQFK
jgi:hypothetical protein